MDTHKASHPLELVSGYVRRVAPPATLALSALLGLGFRAWCDSRPATSSTYVVKRIEGAPVTQATLGGVPPIREARFVSSRDYPSYYQPDEQVLGVDIGGEAKAYSTWYLDIHELVMDRAGAVPIFVTW